MNRLAGACAILAGVFGFLYSAFFVAAAADLTPQLGLTPSWFLLLVGSLLGSFALVFVYLEVREIQPAVALWSLVLGAAGAVGAVLHGGYELALAFHPPAVDAAVLVLPSQVDARGLMTFGASGLALLGLSWLLRRSARYPKGLANLGFVSAVLLLLIYLGRLVVLAPTNPLLLVPAAVEGFVVNPVWYVWLGMTLRRRPGG